MSDLYQPIEPYEHGMLDVGDGQRIYWESCGNPDGKPAVVFHGGPGSGCTPGSRRPFDPEKYRIVVFDQRGCGRSTPRVDTLVVDLAANTTQHLISDIEALRVHLGIEKWLIFGASWGSTLALAYSEQHPSRVSEIILAAITTTTRSEVDWITGGIGQFFPEAYERFRAGAPGAERIVDAYFRLLMSSDPAVHAKAARDWCDWEIAIVELHPRQAPSPRFESSEFRLVFARLVTHYWRNIGFLEDGQLLRNAHRLAGIPGVMIHGRLDLTCPLQTAWDLSKAWPGCELVVIAGAGHGGDVGMTSALVDATDRFALVLDSGP